MTLTESYISLRDLHFHAYHGVLPQERKVGNDYVVNVKVKVDVAEAMVSDNVEATVNYATLYNMVKEEMNTPSALLENVAYRIADRFFSAFPTIQATSICVRKVNPPFGADSLGAEVETHFTKEKTE